MHPRLPRGYRRYGIRPRTTSGPQLRRERRAAQAASRRIDQQQAQQAAEAAVEDALGPEERARQFTAMLHDALANGFTLDVAVAPHFRASLSIKTPAGW